MTRRKWFNPILIVALGIFLLISYRLIFPVNQGQVGLKLLWWSGSSLILGSFISYAIYWPAQARKFQRIQKDYRVVAIVPAFNEETHLLHQSLESILNQSFPVSAIHVVDDGSVTKLVELVHPKITYHYQSNQGKRYAQKKALDSLNPQDYNYVLAVDSDSVLDYQAVENLVRTFEGDSQLKACTGVVLTRNRKKNLITKVADLNIGITCLLGRPIRSLIGSLETTSGALALYASDVVFDHLEEYVTSGTYSDDRQLCLYSLLAGKAVGISEAIVYSEMPEDIEGTVKQRLRWAKGSWKAVPFQLKHLTFKQLFFPLLGMGYLISLPFFVVTLGVAAYYGFYSLIMTYIFVRLGIRYLQSLVYLAGRSTIIKKEYLLYMLLIIPLEFLFNSIVLIYLKYKALFYLKETDWLTRKVPEL